jgi:DNA/RNA-binding domain of Phe-tRNA-synthetase-like protein
MKQDFTFYVDSEVKTLGLKGVYLVLSNIHNLQTDESFETILKNEVNNKLSEISPEWIENNSVLAGFRKLHTKVNRSNKKFIASPENLYNYLYKYRHLPRINLLVDIYNLISIKYGLALGSHDISNISGNVTLRLTNGNEIFIPLGQTEAKVVQKGDYAYIDDGNEVICHLEVRQVEKTKITTDTKDAFYIIQGNENTSDDYLRKATEELIELTKRFCGGNEKVLLTV